MRTLIYFAHPALQKARAHRLLFDRLSQSPDVTFHDLYELYEDMEIDVRREQDLMLKHDLFVFMHPFYWYSSPSILKKWQDVVLEFGFAYGGSGNQLDGKSWLSAITTGGPEKTYHRDGTNRFTVRELLTPFEQTAHLCRMKFLPPHVIYDVGGQSDEQLKNSIDAFIRRLALVKAGEVGSDHFEKISYLHEIETLALHGET